MRETVSPDYNKAKSLFKMSEVLLTRVKDIPLADFPSPNLSDMYDIIHMLLDGILISKGIKFRGEGAHFEMIKESKKLGIISQGEEVFIQQMRDFRNRYRYEGFDIDSDYVIRNEKRIFSLIEKIKSNYPL